MGLISIMPLVSSLPPPAALIPNSIAFKATLHTLHCDNIHYTIHCTIHNRCCVRSIRHHLQALLLRLYLQSSHLDPPTNSKLSNLDNSVCYHAITVVRRQKKKKCITFYFQYISNKISKNITVAQKIVYSLNMLD